MPVPIGSAIVQLLGGGYSAYKSGQQQYEDRQRQLMLQDKQLKQQEEDRARAAEDRQREIQRRQILNQYEDENQQFRRDQAARGKYADEQQVAISDQQNYYNLKQVEALAKAGSLTAEQLQTIKELQIAGHDKFLKSFVDNLVNLYATKNANATTWKDKGTPPVNQAAPLPPATGGGNTFVYPAESGEGTLPTPEVAPPVESGDTTPTGLSVLPPINQPTGPANTLPLPIGPEGYPELQRPNKPWNDVLSPVPNRSELMTPPAPPKKIMIAPISDSWYIKNAMPLFDVVQTKEEAYQLPMGNGLKNPLRNEQGNYLRFKPGKTPSYAAAKAVYDYVHNYWKEIGVTKEDILNGRVELDVPKVPLRNLPPPTTEAGTGGQGAAPDMATTPPPVSAENKAPTVAPPPVNAKPMDAMTVIRETGMMPTDIAYKATKPVSYTGDGMPPYLEVDGYKINVPADIEDRTQKFIESGGKLYVTDPTVVWNYLNNYMRTDLPAENVRQRQLQDTIAAAIANQQTIYSSFGGQTFGYGGGIKNPTSLIKANVDPMTAAKLANIDANIENKQARTEYIKASMENMEASREIANQRIKLAYKQAEDARTMKTKEYELAVKTLNARLKDMEINNAQGQAAINLSRQRLALEAQKFAIDEDYSKYTTRINNSLANVQNLEKEYDDYIALANGSKRDEITGQTILNVDALNKAENALERLQSARQVHQRLITEAGNKYSISLPNISMPPSKDGGGTPAPISKSVPPPAPKATTAKPVVSVTTKPAAKSAPVSTTTLPTFKSKGGKTIDATAAINALIRKGLSPEKALERVNSVLKANGQQPLVINKKK